MDGAATIRRVAEHIGVEASPELIDKVIEGSSFSAMSSQAVANNDGEGVGHLRKGDVGDWRRHFSPALSDEVRAISLPAWSLTSTFVMHSNSCKYAGHFR